ncbi:MAG: hypothetical protein IAF58_05050 [Leptolyngbya sp.]|nr:hypothetical protein [Candidatus Melainabacteria bacterium]
MVNALFGSWISITPPAHLFERQPGIYLSPDYTDYNGLMKIRTKIRTRPRLTALKALTAASVNMIVAFLLAAPAISTEGGGTPGDGSETAPPQDGGPVQSNPAPDGVKPQDDPMRGDVPTKPDIDPDDKPPPGPSIDAQRTSTAQRTRCSFDTSISWR